MIMSIKKKYDVLTFGDMCVDLIVTGEDVVPQFNQAEKLVEDYELEMGGSCNIFACQAAKLGLRVGVYGRVGDDHFGKLVIRRLTESGVDVQHVYVDPSLKTGLGIALCRGNDRAILTYLGSLNAIYPEDISDELLQSARHLHHGSFFLQSHLKPAIPDIFARAHSSGLSTSLDTNWDPAGEWDGRIQDAFALTDVFLPNEQEARFISRTSTVEDALQVFQKMGILITVVKQEEKGALVASKGERYHCVLPPITGGNGIGAGDSFDAGFLAGWLRGMPLDQCLQIACQCGREVAADLGSIRNQPNWAMVTQRAGIKQPQK